MRLGSIRRGALSIIIISLLVSIILSPVSAQEERQIINEISEDFSKDMVLIYIETPNKFDRSYGTNITDKAVLDEISAIEDLLDPQKDDRGEQDRIAWVLSISTLIKEINQAPSNVWDASVDEFDPLIDPGPFPGDSEYAIPDNQDDIDQIVEGIPEHIKDLFVRDTNNDRIWDSAIIWMGTTSGSQSILNKIDTLIDKYNVDPQVDESNFNSRNNWWQRVQTGEIHCQMSNLGYVKSHEAYYGAEFIIGTVFSMMVLFILVALTAFTLIVLRSRMRKGNGQGGAKKNSIFALLVFVILIAINVSLILMDTHDPNLDKYDNFSSDFDGGQMGLVMILGSSAPPDDEPFIGSRSMKDIEVLDDMERFEDDLKNIRDSDNPNENPVSPLTIIDIMKMIKVPESMKNQIPMELIPDLFKPRVDEILNSSFWDAIHTAGQIDNILWYARYPKSLQDTLINIFYKSITPELRLTFVNEDYSRSLFYLQLPMRESEQSDSLKDVINLEVANHRPFISISNVALMSSGSTGMGSIAMIAKTFSLFIILMVGILMFLFLNFGILDFGKKNKGDEEVLEVQEEAIFPDITDEGEPYHDDYPHYKYPPPPDNRP